MASRQEHDLGNGKRFANLLEYSFGITDDLDNDWENRVIMPRPKALDLSLNKPRKNSSDVELIQRGMAKCSRFFNRFYIRYYRNEGIASEACDGFVFLKSLLVYFFLIVIVIMIVIVVNINRSYEEFYLW